MPKQEQAPWAKPQAAESAPWERPKTDEVPHGTIGPNPHPIESRINDFIGDIEHGPGVNDNRPEARALRFLGFHSGTQSGGTGNASAFIPGASAMEGVPELIHAGSRIPQVHDMDSASSVGNEALSGTFKTLGTVAPFAGAGKALPQLVPAIATGMATAKGTKKAASLIPGVTPNEAELAGNVAAVGTGAAHETGLMGKAGDLIQSHAPAIGKTAGALTTIGGVGADIANGHFGAHDLIYPAVSPIVSKVATAGTRVAGNLISGAGHTSLIDSSLGDVGQEPRPLGPDRQLGTGAIQLPARDYFSPPEQSKPMTVDAQPIISRGKGGRMQKSYGTGTGEPLINPGPAWSGPGSSVEPGVNNPLPASGFTPRQTEGYKPPPTIEAPLITPDSVLGDWAAGTGPEAKVEPEFHDEALGNSLIQIPKSQSPKFDPSNRTPILDDNLNQIGETMDSHRDIYDQISNDPRFGNMPLYATVDANGKYTGMTGDPDESLLSDDEHFVQLTDKDGNITPEASQEFPGLSPEEPVDLSGIESLTKSGKSPIINNGEHMQDTSEDREMNSDLINSFESDQQRADDLAQQDFYRRNKPDVGKKTGKQYKPDTETLFPWAQHPYGDR